MKAFFTTIVMGFRHYFRDRSTVFWGILFPLILMGLIGLAFGRSDKIGRASCRERVCSVV